MNRTDRGLLLGITAALVAAMVHFASLTSLQAAPPPPQPKTIANVFATAVNANTDVFTAISPVAGRGSVAYRLTIALTSTNSIVNVQISDGSTTTGFDLNDGTALTSGRLYTFVLGCHSDYSYTIQYETGTTTGYLLLEQIRDGVL